MKKQKYAMPEIGKTYKFAGYDWTVCEVDNDRHTAVIQSHGVTHGAWPGFKMQKFGNGDYYPSDIDGQDISSYDDKMQKLYDTIKDTEDSSASYGKGLFLVSKEKVGCTELGKLGSGNYWKALKTNATNFGLVVASYGGVWLGTVYGSNNTWYVFSNGNVHYGNSQSSDFVVAPAFNLDLSKVEIVENEIVIKEISENKNADKTMKNSIKKARLILAVTDQVTEDGFERHYKTVEIEVPENEHIDLSKCDIIGGEWIS